uniref:Uncharacterized protein n=1 Tax=Ciona savignyi TaxID=51511 RepID=H2YTF0_CIOSA
QLKKLKNVNQQLLLEQLHERFTTSQKKWKIKAAVFAVLYFTFLVVIALLQVAQVVVFQLDNSVVSKSVKTSVGTILPAITGGVLAVQMRLLW